MANEFLRGKVVRILDDQRIVINLGMNHGVQTGDHFYIYEAGEEIQDPVTNEPLGKLELVKAEVEAVHVQEKISFVMPPEKKTDTLHTVLSAAMAQVSPTGHYGQDPKRDRLHIRTDQVSGSGRTTSPIALGDNIRSINRI